MVYKLKRSGVPGIQIKLKQSKVFNAWRKKSLQGDLPHKKMGFMHSLPIIEYAKTHRGFFDLHINAQNEIINILKQKKQPRFLELGAGNGVLVQNIAEQAKKLETNVKITAVSLMNPVTASTNILLIAKKILEDKDIACLAEKLPENVRKMSRPELLKNIDKNIKERKKELAKLGIDWINSPVERLKFEKNQKFDCIISSYGALTYSPMKKVLLNQQLNLLDVGGKLVIKTRHDDIKKYFSEKPGFHKETPSSDTVIYTRIQ